MQQDKLVIHPTSLSQWQALVSEASHHCDVTLNEDLESYLVFLLMRFAQSPETIDSVVALKFLEAAHQALHQQQLTWRDVGDQCLLFSGLFPGLANRRRVTLEYYVKIGRTAYAALAETHHEGYTELFEQLARHFVGLMDVLQSMREINQDILSLEPLQAAELWETTGSKHALKSLQTLSKNGHIIVNSNPSDKPH